MFDALLRMQLGPIVERLAEMESQLEDLYRRAESFCRIGICQQVDAASNTFRVRLTLPNPNLQLPAGLRCRITFGEAPAAVAAGPAETRQPGGLRLDTSLPAFKERPRR
mgnify:CR=1 FL=1